MKRREFITTLAGGALATSFGLAATTDQRTYKAAIIGYTGHGNYGHEHELTFAHYPGVVVVAVADPDDEGRVRAQKRANALRAYADYEEMLDKERPDLVTVATRWSTLHYLRIRTALQAGAHVLSEKPFTENLRQADELLALAKSKNLKIAVAHQARLLPQVLEIKRRLSAGEIGELLEIRIHSKDDNRAGGEDMLVLGIHQFHLTRYFVEAGPEWCSARILQDNREVTLADAHPASEADGPIIGNSIRAQFAFPKGLNVYFTSDGRYQDPDTPYSMELIGSRGKMRLTYGFVPWIWRDSQWHRFPGENAPLAEARKLDMHLANRRVADDWIAAIEANREPACGGRSAMEALEMVHGVFAAGISRGRVEIPLRNREHPLEPMV